MKQGTRGDMVKKLQGVLAISADGQFGSDRVPVHDRCNHQAEAGSPVALVLVNV